MISSDNEIKGRQTLIEEDSTFRGSLDAKCPIVVNGRMEGEISGPSLVINVGGAVQGTVKVTEIRSAGELQGDFEADRIHFSGRVCDDTVIRAKTLDVKLAKPEEAAIIFGECELEIGEAPTIEEVHKRRAEALKPPKVAAATAPVAKAPVAQKQPAVTTVATAATAPTKPVAVEPKAADHKPIVVEQKAPPVVASEPAKASEPTKASEPAKAANKPEVKLKAKHSKKHGKGHKNKPN